MQNIHIALRASKRVKEFIEKRQKSLGLTTFKAYFLHLIEKDGYKITPQDI